MHVERTFQVDPPPSAVFDYLADFTRTEEWDPGTVETTRISGDGGLGTTYRNVSEFMGRRVELTYETVEFEPSNRVVFRGSRGKTETRDTLSFAPSADGGTTITYRADFHFGFPLNVIAPIAIRGKLEKLADETVEQLRTRLN
ncbi:SRPBCC family protein [Nocardioides sp. R-C-SC26]|uniref:SRPBCC family protein n=1 Tax=Nocardioides sp. R-C-SC26 TaxID=2870414 RepID=UPI001E3EAC70|nr:SRPBCC family protein [Nocardioides sp. R-C-SC26]